MNYRYRNEEMKTKCKRRWTPCWSAEGTTGVGTLALASGSLTSLMPPQRSNVGGETRNEVTVCYSLFRTLMSISGSFDLASIFPSHIYFCLCQSSSFRFSCSTANLFNTVSGNSLHIFQSAWLAFAGTSNLLAHFTKMFFANLKLSSVVVK